MKQNSEYRAEARQALEGKWGDGALVTLVYFAVSIVCSYAFNFALTSAANEKAGSFGTLIGTLICMPIAYAIVVTFLRLFRGMQIGVKDLFAYYNGRVFSTMVLRAIYQFLWSLLFVIPGIIKYYSYAMTEYVMLDDPNLQNNAAIEKSMALMKGKKMKLFLLDLSFIGWAILSCLTIGLGFLLLEPYMDTARAAFYEDLKAEAEA